MFYESRRYPKSSSKIALFLIPRLPIHKNISIFWRNFSLEEECFYQSSRIFKNKKHSLRSRSESMHKIWNDFSSKEKNEVSLNFWSQECRPNGVWMFIKKKAKEKDKKLKCSKIRNRWQEFGEFAGETAAICEDRKKWKPRKWNERKLWKTMQ